MKIRNLFLLLIFLILSHCGYSTIYSNLENNKFYFELGDIKGDEDMNNLLILSIEKLNDNSVDKKFNLNAKTIYEKNIISKNKAGEPTNYLVVTEIEFEITNLNNKKISFKDQTNIENINNKYELANYESSIKENFINSKVRDLILRLSINE